MRSYLLWIGSVYSPDSATDRIAVSPAGNRWQLGLVDGLLKLGTPVRTLGHARQRVWPFGPFTSPSHPNFHPEIPSDAVPYLNLPVLRTPLLTHSYIDRFRAIYSDHGAPSAIITYNSEPWSAAVGRYAQSIYRIPWICIHADLLSPGSQWQSFLKASGDAAGHIVLSYWAFKNAPVKQKFHLDGGVDQYVNPLQSKPDNRRCVLYTGEISTERGIWILLSAFAALPQDTTLRLTGRLHTRENWNKFHQILKDNPRIIYEGMVSPLRLRQLYDQSSILVNPRIPDRNSSRFDFPSKILEYLSYGKPVLSNRAPGIGPEYDDLLFYTTEPTAAAFGSSMIELLKMDAKSRERLAVKTKRFIEGNKTWAHQTKRLLSWIEPILQH